jgi:hypothetical protein
MDCAALIRAAALVPKFLAGRIQACAGISGLAKFAAIQPNGTGSTMSHISYRIVQHDGGWDRSETGVEDRKA